MKTKSLVSFLFVALAAVVLTGCGKKAADNGLGILDTAKGVGQLADVGKDFEKAQATGNPEDLAKAMQNYGEVAATFEEKEFDKAEAVDAPAGFPKELIYSAGKILEAEDSSDDNYVDWHIKIKAKEDGKATRDYYKNLFSASAWKITNQSAESTSASFTAKNGDSGYTAEVEVNFPQYGSKLTEIQVYYRGDKTK